MGAVQYEDLTYDSALYVAQRMREWDAREIYATRWDDRPEGLAKSCMAHEGFSWCFTLDGIPTAAIGGFPMWPNVWAVWCFGTDDFPHVALGLTRFVVKGIMPSLRSPEVGVSRVQCMSMEGHEDAHKWLTYLGGEKSAPIENFGKERETFYMFQWVK